jgi:hypothetical protein
LKPNLRILVVVLALATAVGAFAVMHPKTDPKWKEYRNEEIGYSYKYPASWIFGPLPGECKQNPPEEMPQECLCFLNAEDPDNVFLQTFRDDEDTKLTLASFKIAHYASPAFSPPPHAELVPWIKTNFSEIYINIPKTPNLTLDGKPAVAIKMPSTASTSSYEDIFFVRDNKLFLVTMLNPTNKGNQTLYDQILSTFSWCK